MSVDVIEQPAHPAEPRSDAGLADTQAWYHSTFQDAGAGIAHVAPQGAFLAVNDRFCAIVGRSREDLLALDFRRITHPQDRALDEAQVAALLAGELPHYTLEKRYLRPDGSPQWVQLTVGLARHADGRARHLVTVIEDIGARKAAQAEREAQQAALQRSQAHLAAIHAQTAAGLCETDLAGRHVDANAAFCHMVGRSREQLLGMYLQDITHPQDLPGCQAALERLLRTGRPFTIEKRYLRPDGRAVWAANTVSLIEITGQPPRVLSVSIDVTARRQAEEALRSAEAELRRRHALLETVLDSTADLVCAKDLQGRYILMNQAGARLLDRAVEDVVGHSDLDLFPPPLAAPLRGHDARVLSEGRTLHVEESVATGAGDDRTFLSTKTPLRDTQGQTLGVVSVSVDITERKAAEAALASSLQAREALLHEVNHRVKNNLQLISSLLTLQARGVQDEDARQALAQARARVGVMAQLHQQLYLSGMHGLLDFARHGRRLAADTLATIASPGRITLDFACDEAVVLPLDVAVPLTLIVSELITNAVKYAFPDGRRGTLTLQLRRTGGELQLLVADDGPGLPPGFEPARDAGLGLRIVTALTRQLHGRLALPPRSTGAAFLLLLPAPR